MRIETFTDSGQLPELIDGSPLHSALMFRSQENSKSNKPYMLVAYDTENREIGHLLVIRQRGFRLFPHLFSQWYTINGEGVYRNECNDREAVFGKFLERVFELSGFLHSFIRIENIEDSRFAYGTLRDNDFAQIRDQRMYISLHSKDPQTRLTRAYRAHIRKAESNGVSYLRATEQKDIDEGLQLLHNYYISKTRRRLPAKNTLNMMLHDNDGTLSEKAKLFIVKYRDKAIGSSFCLYDNERAYLLYTCGLRKSHPMQYPGIMAIWAALNDAYRKGFAHFEFLEARALSSLHKRFLKTLLNYGVKEKGTLRWYRYRWSWVNKFLRAIYV